MLKSFSAQTNPLGAINYKGTWDASTNTPALASSVGTKGDYYVVSVAGSTTLNGISNWGVGDWAVFNGSVWQRVEGGADLNGVNLTVSGTSTLTGKVTAQTLTIGLGGQTSVADNTALGFEALNSASLTGAENTAVGYQALAGNTTGANNTAVGRIALISNFTGSNNTAFGHNTLIANITASNNSAMGQNALLFYNTANNTAVGFEAIKGSATVVNNTGANLTAVGYQALTANTSGSDNTGVGDQAGDVITTGARNTIIGANSDPSAAGGNDQTVVGEGLTGKGDDTAFIGGTNGAYNEKNVITWEITSDQRIKKNIVSNNVGLEVISQIDVRNFEYRTAEEITDLPASAAIDQSGVQLGVIAQELQAVLPECVTENSTGVLSVNTDQLIWYLVNSVKQLNAEIQTLKGV
jgi:hypothetical protein